MTRKEELEQKTREKIAALDRRMAEINEVIGKMDGDSPEAAELRKEAYSIAVKTNRLLEMIGEGDQGYAD